MKCDDGQLLKVQITNQKKRGYSVNAILDTSSEWPQILQRVSALNKIMELQTKKSASASGCSLMSETVKADARRPTAMSVYAAAQRTLRHVVQNIFSGKRIPTSVILEHKIITDITYHTLHYFFDWMRHSSRLVSPERKESAQHSRWLMGIMSF